MATYQTAIAQVNIYPKYSSTLNLYYTCPKIWTRLFYYLFMWKLLD